MEERVGSDVKAKYLYCGMVEPDPDWHARTHRHDGFFEFIGITSGKGRVRYNGRLYDIIGPALFVYEPARTHEEWSDKANPWRMFYIAGSIKSQGQPFDFRTLYRLVGRDLIIIRRSRRLKNILSVMMDIYGEISKQRFGWKQMANGLFYGFIRHLLEAGNWGAGNGGSSPRGGERRKEIADKVKRYVDEHYHEKLSLDDLTEAVYLSPYYLSHLFKAETGCSPIQYVINRKMEIARKLLAHPDLTVSQVAKQVGYESIHYFSRLFAAVEGVSPTSYRKKAFKSR
jgi:AraC-like DNA-binding protein